MTHPVKAAVFGTGSWGTAFAVILADAGCEVTLWGRRAEVAETINTTRTNPDYLPGIALPDTIRATTDPAEALRGAEFAFLVVPSQTLRANLADWAPHLESDTVLVSLMKGVELGTAKLMSEVIADVTKVTPTASPSSRAPTWPRRSPSAAPPPPSSPAPTNPSPSGSRPPATPRTSGPTPTPTWSAASSAAP
ncbi:hypothetical protein Smic_60390 [Streptomyces microflavus]|uniref:Glycerol-3-phosphate dehydrogenase NAD-dependent N-terminal domain-containing protein n=1 Tax=Streptomyces microflavus TaxID=1919 RepID=A0A7J0CYF0_STRMI|nr:hypothetical protein Smic_60390 [Streptomyces microflavus]